MINRSHRYCSSMYGRGSPVRSQFSPPIVASFVGRDTWTSYGLGIIYDTIRSHPVLAENIAGKKFHYFLNFFTIFFEIFLHEYERNPELKFCFHFFGLSHPVLPKNNAGKTFHNFLNFFTIFFGIFLSGSSVNGIRD